MEISKIMQIFADTAYVRMGGSDEELACAKYIQSQCAAMGLCAGIEPFAVNMAMMRQAELLVDGEPSPVRAIYAPAAAVWRHRCTICAVQIPTPCPCVGARS